MSIKITHRKTYLFDGLSGALCWYIGFARHSWTARVLCLLLIPFLFAGEMKAQEKAQETIVARIDQLPVGVQRMHTQMLRAARSGEIENMREVLEMNELMPLINGKFHHDPVKHWKNSSKDKSGREILALLSEILELPPVKKTGKSGTSYIWPYFARTPLDKLSASQLVQLYRLAPASKIALMLKNNSYSHASVIIGSDGTWHAFGHAFEPSFAQSPRSLGDQ